MRDRETHHPEDDDTPFGFGSREWLGDTGLSVPDHRADPVATLNGKPLLLLQATYDGERSPYVKLEGIKGGVEIEGTMEALEQYGVEFDEP